MELAVIVQKIKEALQIKSLRLKFVIALSTLWLFLEPIAAFRGMPNTWLGYFLYILISIALAIILNWPRHNLSRRFDHNDLTISITKGDVLSAESNIVIGFSDTFDTEIGSIIRQTSLQGQFQANIYRGNVAQLDDDLSSLLKSELHLAIHDPEKKSGKKLRFPIGTTVVLDKGKRYFLLVYTHMNNDLACDPTPASDIVSALFSLWDRVRIYGQNEPLSMPIIASDLARSGISRTTLIKLIALSFFVAHTNKPVTKQLNIYVHPADIEHVDFNAIKDFINNM